MKVLIDITEESYKFAKECKSKGSSKYNWCLSHNDVVFMIANGTPIPDNATIGDMIKAMLQIKDEDIKVRNSCVANIVIEYVIDTDNYLLRFDNNFWNAPYGGGVKNG